MGDGRVSLTWKSSDFKISILFTLPGFFHKRNQKYFNPTFPYKQSLFHNPEGSFSTVYLSTSSYEGFTTKKAYCNVEHI